MRTRAKKSGDKYVLNGSKCFITNGGYADWFTVYAKTDPEAGHRGISAFLVRKDDTVIVDKKEDKMGQRASNTATITFNDTEVDAKYLLGEENKGFKLAMMTLDRTRPGVAAMATGIARAAFEFATEYSKERVQFGVPIAMHQAIQFMIADMSTKVHLSRLATWNSAVLLDQGKRNTLESSHAKRFAADSAMEVTTDAVQVYGGYGFIKDYPVEKLMRDAKIMQLYEGTSQIQRLVIARETLLPRRIEAVSRSPPRTLHAVACEAPLEGLVGAVRLLAQVGGHRALVLAGEQPGKAERKTRRCVHASVRATTAGTRSPSSAPVSSAITGLSAAASCSQPRRSRSRSDRLCATSRGHAHDRLDGVVLDALDELERRRAEGLDDRRPRGTRPDRLDEGGPALLAAVQDEVLLGGEVVEDRLLRDVGGAGDVGDGHGVEPMLDEQRHRGLRDRLARLALLALAQSLGRGRHRAHILTYICYKFSVTESTTRDRGLRPAQVLRRDRGRARRELRGRRRRGLRLPRTQRRRQDDDDQHALHARARRPRAARASPATTSCASATTSAATSASSSRTRRSTAT